MTIKNRKKYLTFLLRFWREGENSPWRATLESPYGGKQYAFSSLEKLFAFLKEKTDERIKKEFNNEKL